MSSDRKIKTTKSTLGYNVVIDDELVEWHSEYGPWFAWTFKGAVRKGRRMLRSIDRMMNPTTWTVDE